MTDWPGIEKVFWSATYSASVSTWRQLVTYFRANKNKRLANAIESGINRRFTKSQQEVDLYLNLRFRDGSIAAIDAAAKELDLL